MGANVNANFDTGGNGGRKVIAMDLADALTAKHNMEDTYENLFVRETIIWWQKL